MSEKEFGSSINEYEEVNKPNRYIKQLQWDMAIDLQKVDNLKLSKHLDGLIEENIIGKLSLDQVKEKSVYFRNALVRSNYFNNELGVKEDKSYLIKFYENLLLGKNNNLHSEDLIVKDLVKK